MAASRKPRSPAPSCNTSGGFDPVVVIAAPGDRLHLQLTHRDGDVTESEVTVPIKKPPVVVRMAPAGGRTDVALSVRPVVVFSEPVDPATLSVGMRLLAGGVVVSGRIELPVPWQAEFVPEAPLAPSTTYRLELTPGKYGTWRASPSGRPSLLTSRPTQARHRNRPPHRRPPRR